LRLFAKPALAEIDAFLCEQRRQDFSYLAVGATRSTAPAGFQVDRNRILLGHGEETYRTACSALRRWQMFPSGWTEIQPAGVVWQPGSVVAVLARCFGRWWLNSCRVVYTFDEANPSHRYGFAYGTLPGHVECGEERFAIEWDDQDRVWYEIYSFSRPRHWLVRLAAPLARRMQKQFARQSMTQMQKVVSV